MPWPVEFLGGRRKWFSIGPGWSARAAPSACVRALVSCRLGAATATVRSEGPNQKPAGEAVMNQVKKWGAEEFWGLGFEFDPQWLLHDEQKALQAKLIDLASTTLRDNAVESDKKLLFPRKNFEALAKHGLLGLMVPKELGGLGQNHVCAAMVVETIARYGCASTAMCYTMHTGAVSAALLRHHNNKPIQDILRRIYKDGLIAIAKRHTTMKKHVDVGMRVADYPTIQDYFGEAISDTNASRSFVYLMGQAMDAATNNCDWSIHKDLKALPRAQYLHWMWQVKFNAAKNVAHVSHNILHACGGTRHKPRLSNQPAFRHGQGRWGLGPSHEVLRQCNMPA